VLSGASKIFGRFNSDEMADFCGFGAKALYQPTSGNITKLPRAAGRDIFIGDLTNEVDMSATTEITVIPTTEPVNRRQRRKASSLKARRWINVREVANRLGISVPSVWRGVSAGRLPSPSYPTPQAARWDMDELDRAMEALKALPREAMASRRSARIATQAAE
jgi:predicted DNA-binding transcriptional regulator AlpA